MMNNSVFESAMKLPMAERYQLVEAILDSMDAPDPLVEKAWAQVADDRLTAYRCGEIKSLPAQDLIDQLRAAS